MEQNLNKYYKTKFRDVNLSLSLNPITNDFSKLSHMDSVKKRVQTLVKTQLYDRPYQPALGSQITGMLFEFGEFETLKIIEEMIINLIRAFEPAVDVLTVGVNDFQDGKGIQVQIKFSVIDFKEEAELTILLQRIR